MMYVIVFSKWSVAGQRHGATDYLPPVIADTGAVRKRRRHTVFIGGATRGVLVNYFVDAGIRKAVFHDLGTTLKQEKVST